MKPEVKYGLITAAILCILLLVNIYAGLRETSGGTILNAIGWIALGFGIFLASKERRDRQGYLTFGQGVGSGVIVSLVASAVLGVFTYIYFKFINHALMLENQKLALAKIQETYSHRPEFTEEQIRSAQKMSMFIVTPGGLAIGSLMLYFIAGLVLSLIVAAIVRREGPGMFNPEDRNGSF